MKKTILALAASIFAFNANAELTLERSEAYDRYSISTRADSVEVRVDYSVSRACANGTQYTVTNISDEKMIVTKEEYPVRAFCPAPEYWQELEFGTKFTLQRDGRFGIYKTLLVPAGARVELVEPQMDLPRGIRTLNLDVFTYGRPGRATHRITIHGELFSSNYHAEISKEMNIDERTIVYTLSAREFPGAVTDIVAPYSRTFAEYLPANMFPYTTWTIIVQDQNGNSLLKRNVQVDNRYITPVEPHAAN